MAATPARSDESPGIVDLVRAVAPGLSLKKVFADIAEELEHQARHGAHELAAGLLRDHAGFILYPRFEKESDGPGVHGPDCEAEPLAREQERDGPER